MIGSSFVFSYSTVLTCFPLEASRFSREKQWVSLGNVGAIEKNDHMAIDTELGSEFDTDSMYCRTHSHFLEISTQLKQYKFTPPEYNSINLTTLPTPEQYSPLPPPLHAAKAPGMENDIRRLSSENQALLDVAHKVAELCACRNAKGKAVKTLWVECESLLRSVRVHFNGAGGNADVNEGLSCEIQERDMPTPNFYFRQIEINELIN